MWLLTLFCLSWLLFQCSAEDCALYCSHRQAWLSIFLRTCSHWGIPLLNYYSLSPDALKRLLWIFWPLTTPCVCVRALQQSGMVLPSPLCCILCCLHAAWFLVSVTVADSLASLIHPEPTWLGWCVPAELIHIEIFRKW